MLAEIEPSRQITGGVWYSEQEFDKDYIDILLKTCHLYIREPVTHALAPALANKWKRTQGCVCRLVGRVD